MYKINTYRILEYSENHKRLKALIDTAEPELSIQIFAAKLKPPVTRQTIYNWLSGGSPSGSNGFKYRKQIEELSLCTIPADEWD